MEKRVGKKAQQMTVGTIILIVLGILVLVFLVYGFSTGWGNFFDRILNLGGIRSNVDTIRQACDIACNTGGAESYDFKFLKREVKLGDGSKYELSCSDLLNESKIKKVTGLEPRNDKIKEEVAEGRFNLLRGIVSECAKATP